MELELERKREGRDKKFYKKKLSGALPFDFKTFGCAGAHMSAHLVTCTNGTFLKQRAETLT